MPEHIFFDRQSMMVDCLIAFGANEGDAESNFRQAVERLRATTGIEVVDVSEPHSTKAVGGPEGQSEYLNASIRVTTDLSASELHGCLVEIETNLGRERRVRWGPRKIDLDLLLYGDHQIRTETLIVPHPRMSFRRFVLEPSLKIAGNVTHPTSGQTIAQLLEMLDQRANLAVWVEPSAKFLDRFNELLAERKDLQAWNFERVSSSSQLTQHESLAKLVVVFGGTSDSDELIEQGLRFAGPMLDLRSSDALVAEVVAALEAIK